MPHPAARRFQPAPAVALVAVVLPLGLLPAQDLRKVDGPNGVVSACYDTTRDRLMVSSFGGDLWELVGTSWCMRPLAVAQENLSMLVHDPVRHCTYAFGGGRTSNATLTWVSRGATWTAIPTTVQPLVRWNRSYTFDEARAEVVAFGGQDLASQLEVDETWTFDGTTWTQHQPANTPPARQQAAMAYDAARQRTVLWSGMQGNLLRQDLWEWDGTNWVAPSLTTLPPRRTWRAMTYDRRHARIVLYDGVGAGGLVGDVWHYDGQQWTRISPAGPRPSVRHEPHLVYDQLHQEVVMVGGYSFSPLAASVDCWAWDGRTWSTRPELPAKPGRREGMSLATEASGNRLLAFGGDGWDLRDDTWRWDGSRWTDLAVAGPSARAWASLFQQAGRLYLFGGMSRLSNSLPTYHSDTWQWNGTAWTLLHPVNAPTARIGMGVAYDLVHNEAVLFGGGDTTLLGDTWTFNGTNWQLRQPATSPTPRVWPAMANDPHRNRIVLFGGQHNYTSQNDTWEWNGFTWTQQFPPSHPSMSGTGSMAFDPLRQQLVLAQAMSGPAIDLWSYDGLDWHAIGSHPRPMSTFQAQVATVPGGRGIAVLDRDDLLSFARISARTVDYGPACGTNPPELSALTWPTPGASFGLDATGAGPSSFVAFLGGNQTANIPLGSCMLLVAPGQAMVLATTNPHGFASLSLPLPNATALVGTDLFFQVAAPGTSLPSGLVLSRGLQVTVGD